MKAFADLESVDKEILRAVYENRHLPSIAARYGFRSGAQVIMGRFHAIWKEIDPENLLVDARSRIALWDFWVKEGLDLPQLARHGLPKKHLHTIGQLRKARIQQFLEWFGSSYQPVENALRKAEEGFLQLTELWGSLSQEERRLFYDRITALKMGFTRLFMPDQWDKK